MQMRQRQTPVHLCAELRPIVQRFNRVFLCIAILAGAASHCHVQPGGVSSTGVYAAKTVSSLFVIIIVQ